MASTKMQKGSLDSAPAEPHGLISKSTVALDGVAVTRVTFSPGARWSRDLKAYAGTPSCELPHVALVLSGTLKVVMDDGSEESFSKNDVMMLPPGHDAWTVGDEASVKFTASEVQVYAQQGSQHLNVTRSAVTAIIDILMVCRRATLLIWIDQLSIDQFNESEKAQQIQLMNDIYENAAFVIAWIGYPSEESKIGIDKINSLLPLLPVRGMAFGSEVITDDQRDAILGDPNDADNVRCWRAVINLMQQPYFTRGWILHEATALEETKIMVLYSRDSTTLQSCIRLYVTLLSLPPEKSQSKPLLRFLDRKRGSLGNIGLFQCIRRFDSNRTFLRLADLLRDTNITDPGDWLACVLSFSTDTNKPENPFSLTYSLSAEQIYLDYAVWDISYYKDLGILGYLAGGSGDFSSSLPLWVSDWAARPSATPFRTCAKDPERHSYIYRASGKYIYEISLRAPLPESPALLLVSGIRLGALVEPKPATRTSENGRRQIDLRCHSDGICVFNEIPLSEVYWRTSTADSTTYVDENKSVSHRRGGIDRHHPPDDVFVREMLRQVLGSRSAFLLRSKTDPESALVGIGPEIICEGDEIWMLKGGAMLYVLRPKRLGEAAGGVVSTLLVVHMEEKYLTPTVLDIKFSARLSCSG